MVRERDVSMRLSWQGSRIVVVLYDMRYVKVSSLGAYILLGDKEGDGNLESPYNFILEAVLQYGWSTKLEYGWVG